MSIYTEIAQMETNGKWYSIVDTLEIMGISRGTLYDRIKKNKLESKKEGKNRWVWINTSTEISNNTYDGSFKSLNGSQSNIVKELREQVTYWKSQVEQKDSDLREQSIRHDATIFRILDQNQSLLEATKSKRFWQFWK